MKTRDINPTAVRLQPDLKERIKASAKENGRSVSSEIAFQLKKLYLPEGDAA